MAELIKLDGSSSGSGTSGGAGNPGAPTTATATKPEALGPQATVPQPQPESNLSKDLGLTDIFSKTAPKPRESKMVASIVAGKEALAKLKPILGAPPVLEKSLEQEKTTHMKHKLRRAQAFFLLVFAAGWAGALYFYSELSPNFDLLGPNTTHKLHDTNTSLKKLQTDLNKYRFLAVQLDLNDFSYQSDRFFANLASANNPALSPEQHDQFLANLEEAKKALPTLLSDIRNLLNKDLAISTFRTEGETVQSDDQIRQEFEESVKNALRDDRNKIPAISTETEDLQNGRLLDNTLKLVGNRAFVSSVGQILLDDFTKNLNDYINTPDVKKEKALRDVIAKILATTRSDIATVAELKQRRIDWSTVIQQIESETRNVDKHYGQVLLYQTYGGIVYTGYDFDAATNKIVLSGSTRTMDGSNFTLMSNLVDQLELSTHFEDVQMRSFSKTKGGNGGAGEGYSANFKIDLRMEPQKFSEKDKSAVLEKKAPVQTGVKRVN